MQKPPSLLYLLASVFVLLCIFFIPFPFHLFPYQLTITHAIFGPLIKLTAPYVWHTELKETNVYSDFRSMYVLLLLLLLISAGTGLLLKRLAVAQQGLRSFTNFVFLTVVWYLSLQLLKYGLDKVFKHQFYLPEPNILYTPVGQLDKDILYWSSMGTSRGFNLFSGGVEVLAALLLLFRRSRFAGALLAAGVLVQVVAINLFFDISVKLYASFLLFAALFILWHYRSRLRIFLAGAAAVSFPVLPPPVIIRHPFAYAFLKVFVMGMFFFEALYPYIRSRNYNDDEAARPYLHGAYQVQQFISGNDTLSGTSGPVKRFFIHRQGYLIFQDQEDRMQDYKLDADSIPFRYTLTDYQQRSIPVELQYNAADSTLVVSYRKNDRPMVVMGKALNWRRLPLLRKDFHWTVD